MPRRGLAEESKVVGEVEGMGQKGARGEWWGAEEQVTDEEEVEKTETGGEKAVQKKVDIQIKRKMRDKV